MTKKQLFKKLKANGLPQKSGDWKDYELGKSMIHTGKFRDGEEYETLIKWVAEYIGV